MKQYPKYELEVSDEFDIIEFTSSGVKGKIAKAIIFETTKYSNIYNIAFGDKILFSKNDNNRFEIDDEINTDNGDRDMVLATVVAGIIVYTTKYPDRWIIFSGSNKVRTRLYRMAITKNYVELSLDFYIFGTQLINDTLAVVPFDSKTNFTGFVIKRKS